MAEGLKKSQPPKTATPPAEEDGPESVSPSGELVLPARLLARAALGPGAPVVVEVGRDGVRIVPDSLDKVHLEITSHCNLDCPMCVRHGWAEPLGFMSRTRFERVVQGLAPGRRTTLTLSGFGEPLVHPEWPSFVRLARDSRLRVELVTNGLLLNAEVARTLVELGVAQVTVSVDGGNEAAYTRMRGVLPDGAKGAVHHMLKARLQRRQPLSVGVAAVATRSTVGTLPGLLEWAGNLKLDFVSISNIVPHTEAMARETLWERASWASVFRPSAWRPQVRVGRFDMEEATLPLAAALSARGLTYPSPAADDASWRNRCRFAHEGMCAVSWDGRVAPCLSLLHSHNEFINNQTRRVHEYVVGHVDHQPLAEIWSSSAFRAFRQRLRAFDFPPCFHCGGCPLTESNAEDCYNNPAPVCGECLWAQNIVLCP